MPRSTTRPRRLICRLDDVLGQQNEQQNSAPDQMKSDFMKVLRPFSRSGGAVGGVEVVAKAVEHGHLPVLKFLLEHDEGLGCKHKKVEVELEEDAWVDSVPVMQANWSSPGNVVRWGDHASREAVRHTSDANLHEKINYCSSTTADSIKTITILRSFASSSWSKLQPPIRIHVKPTQRTLRRLAQVRDSPLRSMQMQESPPSIEFSTGISKLARRRRRTRHKLSPVAAAIPVSIEDPNDGDKDDNSDEAEEEQKLAPPTIPVVLLTAPLATVPEAHKPVFSDGDLPSAPVRAVGFPEGKARRTGLQAKDRAVSCAHAPDYDEELARAHLFKPPLLPTHSDKRRVAVYYTCERIALFKLLKWMEKSANEGRRAGTAERKKEGGVLPTGLGLAKWKNTMYLEVLHSSYIPDQPVEALGVESEDPFTAQRAAVLTTSFALYSCCSTGCCVFWGLTREEEARRLMMLTPFSSCMMDQVDPQDMEFSYGDRSSIAKDAIVLCTMSVAEKIALSFAMSQSATLGAFETRVEDRIRSTKHIPSSLASVGSIQYSQDDTSKLIGQLFIELADVNIHSSLLDEPEYFLKSQDSDDFKYLYQKMLKYQDVSNRVAILNKRLSILRDLVGVLNQHLTHHQGAKLEWIIIWILVFQVIIAIGWEIFLKDILGYFH
ncbi:unnamed protein product [Phytophthora fragariaefolia]|uniref:Unnamed protein product n=1 Tax=Phytophthora fragariaefolia TaxID=1490495 RepID=A0A9W6Y4M2_9STRA|nr:unnamed protein product [Phytophthora fragariaefolia]